MYQRKQIIIKLINIYNNNQEMKSSKMVKGSTIKGVLHPRPVFGLFLHFSQKLQHIGNK